MSEAGYDDRRGSIQFIEQRRAKDSGPRSFAFRDMRPRDT